MPPAILTKEKVVEILKSKTKFIPNSCWLWQGGVDNDGHATIRYKYKSHGIHRLSLHIFRGFDLNSLFPVCHQPIICNNPNCWNPNHLYEGTALENTLDTIRAGNNYWKNKTHCKHNHEYTEENTHINKYGHRECRECGKLKMRRKRENIA